MPIPAGYKERRVHPDPRHVERWRTLHQGARRLRLAIVPRADAGPRGGRAVLTTILTPVRKGAMTMREIAEKGKRHRKRRNPPRNADGTFRKRKHRR